jgi:hypothetical protein
MIVIEMPLALGAVGHQGKQPTGRGSKGVGTVGAERESVLILVLMINE